MAGDTLRTSATWIPPAITRSKGKRIITNNQGEAAEHDDGQSVGKRIVYTSSPEDLGSSVSGFRR